MAELLREKDAREQERLLKNEETKIRIREKSEKIRHDFLVEHAEYAKVVKKSNKLMHK